MNTPAQLLADFLLARIAAEREAAERARWVDKPIGGHLDTVSDCDCGEHHATSVYLAVDPDRVIAECEARRRVVEWLQETEGALRREGEDPTQPLRLLALPYAGHPDYDPAWSRA